MSLRRLGRFALEDGDTSDDGGASVLSQVFDSDIGVPDTSAQRL